MSEDGLTLEGSEMFFTDSTSACDVAVNPYTGAIYLALNGPSYTGNGPNLIKEFRPAATDAHRLKDEWPTLSQPSRGPMQFRVSERGLDRRIRSWTVRRVGPGSASVRPNHGRVLLARGHVLHAQSKAPT